jgi:hypothetical protein
MSTEMLIIAVVRVLGSFPVLRWAFVGGLLALLVDQSDLFLMNLIDLGGVTDYQRFDKYLDQIYMANFLIVALRWEPGSRIIAIALYLYRMAGFLAFEITGNRDILLAFPNLFEFWFLFVATIKRFDVTFDYSPARLAAVAAILVPAKLFQEDVLHYARWLDDFTAIEAVEAIWDWFTSPVR